MAEVIFHCYCVGVTQRRVLETLAAGCPREVGALRRATGACTGCQSCRPELEALLTAVARGAVALPSALPSAPPPAPPPAPG
jgi:NAD(P)H-nitrite reductase large subunit